MDFWKIMLARKLGGGSGGGSKVILWEATQDELGDKYPIGSLLTFILVKVSDAVPSYDELIGGIVGAPDASDNFYCFPLVANEENGKLYVDNGSLVWLDGRPVFMALDEENAAIVNANYGAELTTGVWVNASFAANATSDKFRFALAYNSASSGGDSAAANVGVSIAWLGSRAGKDNFTFMDEAPMYKVSEAVFSPDELLGGDVSFTFDRVSLTPQKQSITQGDLLSGEGWTAVVYGSIPLVVSAVKGVHTYEDITIDVPSDGTYFVLLDGNDATLYMQTTALLKTFWA